MTAPRVQRPETPAGGELVAATLAYVRTSVEGVAGVAQLDRGDSVPASAVPDHVEHLRKKHVLATAEALAKLDAAAKAGTDA